MSPIDTRSRGASALAESIAIVRHQLEPIRSRRALIDSFRRESLCRLAVSSACPAYATEALETAYAMRWLELGGSVPFPGDERDLGA